jgi:2-polyprenyl-6-methoxyphenol hydroxylase-like FAD-dependent oxidoreductase
LEDALVLTELLQTEATIEQILAAFMTRRYERCRMVVENSSQLGELEMRRAPAAEQAELARASFAALNEDI